MDSKLVSLIGGLFGAAVGVLAMFFVPPAQVILGLGAMALVVAVLFFWNSLRTLGGETPIATDIPNVEHGLTEARTAQKRMLLRALKDLENEKSIGKISDDDFEDVGRRYREEIKAIMREIDAAAEPYRKKAEDIARAHLSAKGLTEESASTPKSAPKESFESDARIDDSSTALDDAEGVHTKKSLDHESQGNASARPKCPACGESNEPDAKFCKACATSMKGPAKIEAPPSTLDAPTEKKPSVEKLEAAAAEREITDDGASAKEGNVDA